MARAHASSVINAPIEQVWVRIRDFNGLPNWHPGVAKSVIEGGTPFDQVGCVRVLTLQNGARSASGCSRCRTSDITTAIDPRIRRCPWRTAATLRLRRVSDGNRTFAEWSASFDADPPEKRAETEDFSNAVFQGGFDALNKHFGG